jgi:ferric-dicitrate binding protein FerR (iron transport regulator)
VRLRAGVDEGLQPSSGVHWAWLAAAVAGATALLLSLQPGPASWTQVDVSDAEVASVQASESAQAASQGLAASVERSAVVPGQSVVSGLQEEVLEAFGRHRLVLAPSSELQVVTWSPRELTVHLKKGEVAADIAKAFPGERVEIRTETATSRVVGTQFVVSLEDSGATRVEVSEGVVSVLSRAVGAEPVRVTAGKSHRVEAVAVATEVPAEAEQARPVRRLNQTKAKRDGYRLIEIDVPPQKAPNAR